MVILMGIDPKIVALMSQFKEYKMKNSNVVNIKNVPNSLIISPQISPKINFNKEKSLEEAPPKRRWIKKELKKKMKFLNRLILPAGNIGINKAKYQPRQETDSAHTDLRESLEVNGWLHDAQPIVVFQDKYGNYYLIEGFHRYEAMVNLGWGGILVDVYEFEDELTRSQYSVCSNHHRKPAKVQTKLDVELEVKKQLDNKLLDWMDEEAIRASIELMAANKTKTVRDGIFTRVMTNKPVQVDDRGLVKLCESSMFQIYSKTGKGPNSEYLLATGKNQLYKSIGQLPLRGDENPLYGLGYSFASAGQPSEQSCKDAFISALYLSTKYDLNNNKIRFYSYIKNPHKYSNSLAKFYDARKRAKENWISEGKQLALFVQQSSGKVISLADLPFEFIGFYPQVLTPDVSDGGKPRERMIVNWCGKPVDKVTGVLI